MSFPIGIFPYYQEDPPTASSGSSRSRKSNKSDTAPRSESSKDQPSSLALLSAKRAKGLASSAIAAYRRGRRVGSSPTVGSRKDSCVEQSDSSPAATSTSLSAPGRYDSNSLGETGSASTPLIVSTLPNLANSSSCSGSVATWISDDSHSTPIATSSAPKPLHNLHASDGTAKHVDLNHPSGAHPVLTQPKHPNLLDPRHRTPLNPFAASNSPKMSKSTNDPPRANMLQPQPPAGTLYANAANSGSHAHLSSANSSQSSLVGKRDEYESASETESTQGEGAGPQTPAQSGDQGTPGGTQALQDSPSSNAANLSGLVCNVHRTTGKEPPPLVGATTTVLGDKLYVFGGRKLSRTKPQLTSNLYELDLIKRHWTKLEVKGDLPPPRYFHSVCALGDRKLVCYGGMSPAPQPADAHPDAPSEVIVMSDIHILDVPSGTWTKINCQESPQGRYAHCAVVLPSSAVFASASAPMSALHHNPSGNAPNQGTLGVALDGTGGAEMVVVGGQDSANHYIEQISIFNLRSLKWTGTTSMGRSCGAYRSVVAPLTSMTATQIGGGPHARAEDDDEDENASIGSGAPMLIYSNYNFLDVKLELQVRLTDGSLIEKPMQTSVSPPGLRFPNGGVIANHFIVSGTFLTSSKQEYALWALDLRTLAWSRIDAGGSIFSHGSWNRGVVWARRNAFIILGNRRRSLVDDYNNRRVNFSNICLVELEAFGLYDNPRRTEPTSDYVSVSAGLPMDGLDTSAAGRSLLTTAEEFGTLSMNAKEIADMEFLAIDSTRIPVNSRLIARRWGPHFTNLMREALVSASETDTATLRPTTAGHPSRISSITITPSVSSGATTLTANTASDLPDARSAATQPRPRLFYLPHTPATLHALLHYLYTSSLPASSSPLATPQVFCSLLQLARPYKIDGLLEAVVERLHESLDGRNAAAIFNAAAMGAGGGDGVHYGRNPRESIIPLRNASLMGLDGSMTNGSSNTSSRLRVDVETANGRGTRNTLRPGQSLTEHSDEDHPSSADTDTSMSDIEASIDSHRNRQAWKGQTSAVVGLQKRGLRGLMEGRRLRERGKSEGDGKVGLGIV